MGTKHYMYLTVLDPSEQTVAWQQTYTQANKFYMKDRCFRLTNEFVTTYGTIFIHMYVCTYFHRALIA